MSPSTSPSYRGNPYEPFGNERRMRDLERRMNVRQRTEGFDPDERPLPPANTVMTIQIREQKTHAEYRARVSCDPLTPNTCQADIHRFHFQIRPTDAGGNPVDGNNKRTKAIKAKEAFESETNDPHVIFNQLEKPKTWYWQARSGITDKNHRWSGWGSWTAPQLPVEVAEPKPPAPTGITLDFDTKDKNRRNRWRAIGEWNEVVNWDVPGGDRESDMHGYIVQIQKSSDGSTPDENGKPWRRFVSAKADTDADTKAQVVRHVIFRRYWYRIRVRSVDRFNRKGDWSDWGIWQRPGAETPPKPLLVTIFEAASDRVAIEWTAPSDGDPDIIDIDVDHFQAQISKSPTFATTYRFDRMIVGERKSFKIHKNDLKDVFYARVRSVNGDHDKSAWIPAKIAGNSNPAATPDGVIVGGAGEKIVAVFTIPGTVNVKHYDQLWVADRKYKFVKCRARVGRHDPGTHPNDGVPSGGSCQVNWWWHSADENTATKIFDIDDRLKINAGTHKDTNWLEVFNILTIDENESLSIKIPQANGAKNLVTEMIMVPA